MTEDGRALTIVPEDIEDFFFPAESELDACLNGLCNVTWRRTAL